MLANPLLATKFMVPPLRLNRVKRVRLVEKLEQGCQMGVRLALICAPAGYGKTTLAVEWLQNERSFVWLTLDETDNDPSRFFTCLVTALQMIAPELGTSVLNMLHVPQLPPVENIVGDLINEINAIEGAFVLVLDDYHHIQTTLIHDSLEFLLNNQPPNLHLLITSREDPAFPLSRLRAGGQLTEIRARDLRFSGEEIHAFLGQIHCLNLPELAIQKLERVTEGWAAGLQLAGLAFQNEDEAESFFDTFNGAHQYIIDYLLDEVLRRQPEEVRHFLTCTSILERFNADLCCAVIAEPIDCPAVLGYLERSNLFLSPLDASHVWFRYHRLFADVLHAGLDREHEVQLHSRAAGWFEANGMPAQAIPHYLAAGATPGAARLVRRLAGDLVRNGELQTLLRWTRSLPSDELRADPTLLAYQALALLMTGDPPGALALLQNDAPLLRGQAGYGALLGVTAWLRMLGAAYDGLQEIAQQALAVMVPEDTVFRVLALLALGESYRVNHNLSASNEAYQEAYQLGLRSQHAFASLAGLANLVFNLYDMGQLRRARGLCFDAQARFTDPRGRPLPVLGMIDIPLSVIHLEQYDLPQAAAYAKRGQDLCQKLFSSGMMGGDVEMVLANVAHIEGRREEAHQIIAEIRHFALERGVAALEDKLNIIAADLYLREGDSGAARACLDQLEIRTNGIASIVAFTRQLYMAEIQMTEGQPELALEMLAPLEEVYRRESNLRRLIRLLGLKAAGLQKLARQAEAVSAIEEAIQLAAAGGYLGVMLRVLPEAAVLLPGVRSTAPEYVDQVLSRLPKSSQPVSVSAPATSSPSPSLPAAELAEPLSDQERKILRLLAAGSSNQEIAETLVISAGTVKWHVHNILGKLDASNRAQAAAKARNLGLI